MQFLFDTSDTPQAYAEGCGKFPDAPEKCPHKDCHAPIRMKKHGFYQRYIITWGFAGNIRIRRYICTLCVHTVSMLPSFCIPRIQYGVAIILTALLLASEHSSIRYVVTKWPNRPVTLTRRHIIYYRDRVIRNRGSIQLALNLMSPEFIELKQITGDTGWTRKFLQAANKLKPPQFNAKYHELTGKSFMSLHNKVS